MITEKGQLIVGIEFKGKVHTDFELRPQIVADSVDAVEDERAQRNESYLGLIVLSKQLIKLGEIPVDQITAQLLMGLCDIDMAEINAGLGRLQKRLKSFRREGQAAS